MLSEFVPPYDAFVVERLREAGAVFLGKANMDEFAMGSSNENSAFYPVRNPWDLDRVPGGSSGGSAAAVAADLAVAALGSDTGGSIRQPAALCGTVGLKPTYGRVSRYGLVAFASSLDQIGPITKTVRDAATLLGAIAGHDPRDSTSLSPGAGGLRGSGFGRSIAGLRIGVPVEYFAAGLDPRVESAVMDAIALFADLGAEPVRVSLPHTRYALSTYYLLAPAEASSNLARFHGVRYGLRVEDDDVDDDDVTHPRGRIRGRSEAPHHARHLRPFGRLLRCLLPEGAEGANPDSGRFRPGFRAMRSAPGRHQPDDRV